MASMDILQLLVVFLAAFIGMLAFGSVLLLCNALKKNNEHARNVLDQLVNWKSGMERAPSHVRDRTPPDHNNRAGASAVARFAPKEIESEPEEEILDPAADGTI